MLDFDGTIVDTELLHYEAFKKTLKMLGMNLTWDEYVEKYLALSDRDFFKKLAPNKNPDRLCEIKSEFYVQNLENVKPFKGALEFIKEVAGRYNLAVVSGSKRYEIILVLERLGILKLFKVIVSDEDVTEGKPSPEPFIRAIEKFGSVGVEITPKECIAVEDSVHGVRAAKSIGMFVIAVTTSYSENALSDADIVVANLKDAISFVR